MSSISPVTTNSQTIQQNYQQAQQSQQTGGAKHHHHHHKSTSQSTGTQKNQSLDTYIPSSQNSQITNQSSTYQNPLLNNSSK